jgi:glycosyltransferase involved in cell wall biosynthesis
MRHATSPLTDKFEFAYVLPSGSTGRTVLEAEGYRVHELPFVEISRRPVDLLRYLPMLLINGCRLYQLARRERAVALHINDFYNLTGYIARWLSLGKLPVLTHVRFLPQALPQILARIWRWLAEHAAQQVFCVSEAVRVYFAAGRKRVHTVYDPLPAGGEKMPPYVVSDDSVQPLRLLYLSNYIRGKGHNFALEAFKIAYIHNSNLELYFVGGDMGMEKNMEFRMELEYEAERSGLGAVVHFTGFATDTEAAMKAHDIVLNFSEAESFSLTCLDALYYGIPLIASNCGGPSELFETGQSGLLVPNRDVQAMAAAINELAGNKPMRKRFSAASRIFVRQKFAPANTYLLLADYYNIILNCA